MTCPLRLPLALAAGLGAMLWLGCDPDPLASQDAPSAKPLRLVLTGYLDGVLEPCGCASAQSGGLDRRADWLKLNKHRYDLVLEGGNLVRADTPLERNKMEWIQTILGGVMGYSVMALGPNDLALGTSELEPYHKPGGDPFVVTDLRLATADGGKAPYLTHRIVPAAGHKVCVLSLVGPEGKPKTPGYEILAPDAAVRAALAAAGQRGTGYDFCLLFLHFGGADAARSLAKTLPGVDMIASFEKNQETYEAPETFERDAQQAGVARTHVVFPGWHGKNMLVWEGQKDAGGSWKTLATRKDVLSVPKVPKGQRPPGSDEEVWNLLIEHKRSIGALGILEQMAEQRPTASGAQYVGNAKCDECHVSSKEVWESSAHSAAWKSLVKREEFDGWPVTKHPDCVSCHVVGYGEKSGFVNLQKTPHLADVGCEACHGPGSIHVEAARPWQGKPMTAEQRAELKAKSKLLPATPATCHRCHDFEQSPGFDFHVSWELIKHGLDK